MINQYEIKQVLGSGAFGSVRMCQDITTGINLAVKKQVKSRLRKEVGASSMSQLAKIRAGLHAVAPLRHKHVLRLHRVLDAAKLDSLYVILEYARYGQIMTWCGESLKYVPKVLNLGEYGGITLKATKRALMQAHSGLQYMHENCVSHGDVKPDNLLLDHNYNIKLCDFGSTRRHKCTSSDSKEHDTLSADGTYPFWSPEMADCSTDSPDSNPYEDDAWALAVSVYCMAFGDPPFYEPNPLQLFEKITKSQIVAPSRVVGHIEEDKQLNDLCSFLDAALSLELKQRVKLGDMKNHAFCRL